MVTMSRVFGKARPIELYRVLRPAAHDWFEAATRRGLSRYTGREREPARLDEWLRDVRAGRGRFVAVVGDPGLGKSRLLFELRRSAEDGATTVVEGQCESYGTVTAFHAFLDVLRQLFDLRPDDPRPEAVEKVVRVADSLGADVASRVPVYLYLLSIRSSDHPLPSSMLEAACDALDDYSGYLTPDKLDTKLDYDSIQAAGSMLGSASLIVLDEDTCIVRAAALMEEFFRHESCGKCTPCREGTSWLFKVLSRIEAGRGVPGDLDLLLSLSGEISGKVLCALGDFATSPVVATVKQYHDEYERHITEQRCPFDQW